MAVSLTNMLPAVLPLARRAQRPAFIIVLCSMLCIPASGINNNLALTPPMGWNSWNAFQLNIDELKIRSMADLMVSTGMRDAGYQYLVVDAGWKAKSRDAEGRLVADPVRFPSGIRSLADYVHARGLKLGIYTDAGVEDCGSGAPGSKGHEEMDARTFAEWGVDYVKEDWCHSEGLDARTVYEKMSRALQATGRPIVFSLCEWGDNQPWLWGASVGELWRTTGDGKDCWDCGRDTSRKKGGYPRGWTLILDDQVGLEKYAGRGHWNDPDLLLVGLPGLSLDEARAHFSLWAILAAPLMASCDLATLSRSTLAVLTNREVVAIDQDALGKEGTRVSAPGRYEVWVRELQDGGRAVALLNRTSSASVLRVSLPEVGLHDSNGLHVRDLWESHEVVASRGQFSVWVPPHGTALLKFEYAARD